MNTPDNQFTRRHFLHNLHRSACKRIEQRHLDTLTRAGVNGRAFVAAGLIGVARCKFERRHFDLDDDGQEAFILPVLDSLNSMPVDVVAFANRLVAPYAGTGGALGQHNLVGALRGDRFEVHYTPISWLAAGARGLVILRPMLLRPLLPAGVVLVAKNANHARALRRNLELPPPPPISVEVSRYASTSEASMLPNGSAGERA